MVLNVTWRDKIRNDRLYGNLPKLTDKIKERRMKLAGHCVRHCELEVGNLVLWEPTHGRSNRGSQKTTYVDKLRNDISLKSAAEIRAVMKDRDEWRTMTRGNSTR